MFLIQKHFVSATNVSQFAQPKKHHGQQCVLVYQGLKKFADTRKGSFWCICCRSNQTLSQFVPTQVNLFQPRSICFNLGQFVSTQVYLLQPKSICFNLGQFDFFVFAANKRNIFGTFDLLFIFLLLFISTLLTSPTIPSLLSQHPSPYSFYPKAYNIMYHVSLEPTFGFPLDSCPDALPLSHGDLDASSTIFLITYIQYQ